MRRETSVAYSQRLATMSGSGNWQPQIPVEEVKAGPLEGGPDGVKGSENEPHGAPRKKIVVVGLGMVGISFM